MKKILIAIKRILFAFGFEPIKAIRGIMGIPYFVSDYSRLYRQGASVRLFKWGLIYPWLADRFQKSGTAFGHYFYQDWYVARKIFEANPELHVDIGSRVDGFVAHIACFRKIEIFDIRPQDVNIANIKFRQVDFMSDLAEDLTDYCDSASCLHALEHFGLGRYGDPVDYYGYLKGLENLRALLKQGGKLYLSVPMGRQRIEFNAHRVFSIKYLLELFDKKFRVESFSYIDDAGDLHVDVKTDGDVEDNFGCDYGCAIFELVKL